jgi:uncharacterized membrane protein
MHEFLTQAIAAFDRHSGWILWNLFLACIPLALSVYLFRRRSMLRSPLWWVAFGVYFAFLPNAPYLLTDIIHLINATRSGYSVWIITLIFIPIHSAAILAGLQAYVVAVMNQSLYLKRIGLARWSLSAELLTHLLCAIGVFMGRFRRFNSWDLVTTPRNVVLTTLDDLTSHRPVAVILVSFLILTLLYWLTKQINLGLRLRLNQMKTTGDWL